MENPFEAIEKRLEAIEKKLEGLIQRIDKPPVVSSPTWVTSKQLAQHLGLSVAAITHLRGSKIPFYKIGGRILFKKQEIDEFLEKTRHKSGGEYLNEYLESNQMNRGKSR
jgi:excisionase family DNA binding protein